MFNRQACVNILCGYLDRALSLDSNHVYIVVIGLALWSQ